MAWLSFACPSCKASLRIQSAYAHLRGRCPECGVRIEALRPPAKAPPVSSTSDEPLGLVPLEEEWPEPARVEEPVGYELAATPTSWPERELPPPAGEAYSLATGDAPPPPPAAPAPSATPYEVLPSDGKPPSIEPILGHVSEAGLIREPPPPPPAWPLWDGIYTYPWRPANLRAWIILAIDCTLLSVPAALIGLLIEIGGAAMLGVPLLLPVIGILFCWIGAYAANGFVVIVEETAAGHDHVTWPRGAGIIDDLPKLLYLLWLGACSAIPAGLVGLVLREVLSVGGLSWIAALISWVIVFPTMLFSSLAAESRLILFDAKTISSLLRRPVVLLTLCLASLGLLVACGWLGYLAMVQNYVWICPLAGLLWSACFLIYARLLGRVGWILSYPNRKKKRPPKILHRPSQPKQEQTEEGTDSTGRLQQVEGRACEEIE